MYTLIIGNTGASENVSFILPSWTAASSQYDFLALMVIEKSGSTVCSQEKGSYWKLSNNKCFLIGLVDKALASSSAVIGKVSTASPALPLATMAAFSSEMGAKSHGSSSLILKRFPATLYDLDFTCAGLRRAKASSTESDSSTVNPPFNVLLRESK